MRLDHFAIWCHDIEKMRTFYTTYFDCASNAKYHNPTKNYTSYFLTFFVRDGGSCDTISGNCDTAANNCRIELMHRPDIVAESAKRGFTMGIAHFDIELADQSAVDSLTERLRADGHTIASEPRRTGDGYYESAILDPEGNYVEISAKG